MKTMVRIDQIDGDWDKSQVVL